MLQQLMAEVCRTSRDSLDKTDALGFYLKGRTEEVMVFYVLNKRACGKGWVRKG